MEQGTVLPQDRSEPRDALVEDDECIGRGRTVVGRDGVQEEGGGVVDKVHRLDSAERNLEAF